MLLLFLHALAFIFWGYSLAFALVFSSFSLPVFFPFGHVLSCSAWPVLRGGLAALCLVSQLSVWSRGALLRRLSQRRCECELDCILARVLHLSSYVHCLSARSIEERFVSPSLTLLFVGRTGWLRLQRWRNQLSAPPSRTAVPLRSSLSLPSRGLLARVSC